MNEIMHRLLNELRVIGKIKEGQKLDTSNGTLYVYSDGWVSWFTRKWYRDSKDECVRHLRDLYRSFGQSVETIINEATTCTNDTRKSQAIYVIINAATELRASIKGLDSLSKTYMSYPTTVAALEGILRDYIIVTYSLLLEAIPENRIPKEFKEPITYAGHIIIKGQDPAPSKGSPKLKMLSDVVPSGLSPPDMRTDGDVDDDVRNDDRKDDKKDDKKEDRKDSSKEDRKDLKNDARNDDNRRLDVMIDRREGKRR